MCGACGRKYQRKSTAVVQQPAQPTLTPVQNLLKSRAAVQQKPQPASAIPEQMRVPLLKPPVT